MTGAAWSHEEGEPGDPWEAVISHYKSRHVNLRDAQAELAKEERDLFTFLEEQLDDKRILTRGPFVGRVVFEASGPAIDERENGTWKTTPEIMVVEEVYLLSPGADDDIKHPFAYLRSEDGEIYTAWLAIYGNDGPHSPYARWEFASE